MFKWQVALDAQCAKAHEAWGMIVFSLWPAHQRLETLDRMCRLAGFSPHAKA